MSDNTQNQEPSLDFKRFSEDFSKQLEKISSNITLLGNRVDEKTSVLETKVESLKKGEDNDSGSQFSDYDKEEEVKIEKLATKIADKKVGQLKQEFEATKKYENDCLFWDTKAGQEFPHIKLPEVKKKVEEELAQMKVIGKSRDGKNLYEPDAVYNAAARVISRMSVNGQLKEVPPPDSLEIGGFGNPVIKGKGANEIQLELCARLGITPERAKEIYKDFQPRRRK